MSNRHNPDEAPVHDTFAGFRRAPLIPRAATVTMGRDGHFLVLPYVPVNGTMKIRAFEHAQDAADWCELHLAGQVIAWEVRP